MVNNVESKIIEVARTVFIEEGYSGARMQRIADVAEINKALLHYYFRSKEKLYDEVVKDLMGQIASKIISILESEDTNALKIETVVRMYTEMIEKHPKLPLFIMNEIHDNPERLTQALDQLSEKIQKVRNLLSTEVDGGTFDGLHMFVNLIGMSVFPFLAKPLLSHLFFDENENSFREFINSRPGVISKTLNIK
ncbi:TetR/AcrR family transcriptional regulator [Prolixibacteraceae bacterium]|nr:TetR/AcrR family transcriptional regulator [Prolixibacteraceae bacterium]